MKTVVRRLRQISLNLGDIPGSSSPSSSTSGSNNNNNNSSNSSDPDSSPATSPISNNTDWDRMNLVDSGREEGTEEKNINFSKKASKLKQNLISLIF